jgi:predicted lipoprotein with Yx(FWY)xxD motif
VKKSSIIGIIIIVLVVVVGGGYALFHKTTPTTKASSTTSSTNSVAAVNNAVLMTKSNSSLGQYLTEPNGQALYTYGGDSNGVSNCTGSCLATWPAYQDKGATTGLPAGVSTIKRTDNGETQFTYNGMPLYTFVGDSNGQVTGNGVSNFTVAKPAATTSSSSTQSTNSTATSSNTTSSGNGW